MKCVVNVSLLIDIQRKEGEKTAVMMCQKEFFYIYDKLNFQLVSHHQQTIFLKDFPFLIEMCFE